MQVADDRAKREGSLKKMRDKRIRFRIGYREIKETSDRGMVARMSSIVTTGWRKCLIFTIVLRTIRRLFHTIILGRSVSLSMVNHRIYKTVSFHYILWRQWCIYGGAYRGWISPMNFF